MAKELYLKELQRHVINASRTDLSDLEKLDLKFMNSGGGNFYRHLHSNIVRDRWIDRDGFPLKDLFHDKQLLACSSSVRHLAKTVGMCDQRIQRYTKNLKDMGWIKTDNTHARKGQTIFILGKWYKTKNEKGKIIKVEVLYRDLARDEYIKQKKEEVIEDKKELILSIP